jgi:hypothetical protein
LPSDQRPAVRIMPFRRRPILVGQDDEEVSLLARLSSSGRERLGLNRDARRICRKAEGRLPRFCRTRSDHFVSVSVMPTHCRTYPRPCEVRGRCRGYAHSPHAPLADVTVDPEGRTSVVSSRGQCEPALSEWKTS